MSMTVSKQWCLIAALVAPGLALADEAAPQAQALGMTEAILEHCARLVPEDAERFQDRAKRLVQGASEETLDKVRKSDEYQQSRDAVRASLAKLDDRNAKKACAQSFPSNP